MEEGDMAVNRLYRCGLCGMMSDDLDALRNHLISVHVSGATGDGADQVDFTVQQEEPSDGTAVVTENQLIEDQTNVTMQDAEMMEYEHHTEHTQDQVSHSVEHVASQELQQLPFIDDHDVNLRFKVKIPHNSMQLFPKHIKPVLSFTCTYCDFKHHSFKEVSLHIFDKHPKKLNCKQRNPEYLQTAAQDVSVVDNSAYLTSKKMKRSKKLMSTRAEETGTTEQQENCLVVATSAPPRVRREFSCLKCHMKTDNDRLLEIHKQCHVEGHDNLVCCFCGKEAPKVKSWYGLYIHMVNKHPEVVPAPLQCAVCKKGFVKEYDLLKHMATHSSHKPYECQQCGLAFKCSANLKQHEILRHRLGTPEDRERLLQKIKDKKMANADNATYILCNHCGYRTKSNAKYQDHIKTHTGEKDLNCEYCSYKTGDKSALSRHMWRHRKEKPYNCKFCDFGCIQRPQIIAHYKNKHSLPASDAKKFIQHISGSRRYDDDLDDDDQIGILSAMGHMGSVNVVVAKNSQEIHNLQDVHHIVQDVNNDNPVDLELLTEAAEGLLAASQIELHTTG